MQPEKIWVDASDQFVNIETVRTDVHGTTFTNRLSDEQLAELGLREITIYQKPDDYSEELYFRTGPQSAAPYIFYTAKSPEMIRQAHNARIDAQIIGLEKQALESGLVRTIIDDLLLRSVQLAAAQGVTEAELLDPNSPNYSRAYEKVYANAAERAMLRSQKL